MSIRPEERRTARAYDRSLRSATLPRALSRLFSTTVGPYVFDTPVLELPREVGLQPGHRVLDLGCGTGAMAELLAARSGLRHDPVGIDVSRELLRLGAQRLGAGRRVELVAAGASRLPFADESFHLVIAAHLFRYLEDDTLYRMLMEAHRVLRPGGILFGWEFAPTSSRRLNRFHQWLLSREGTPCRLRGFGILAPYALEVGFRFADRKRFRLPFLFPPIPRVAVMFQKAREGTAEPAGDSCLAQRLAIEAE
ncbi:MAG TPA: class I SAM-dependent methyltransferase [Dehalococcoidia bacterium]|nr:class I SAM-dependent methyltransferase [Dehalococcoidia bacterium]